MASYIALIRKAEDSEFGVDFPDFPGCITAGETLDEAARRAEEALALHVDGLLEDGGELPTPRSLDQVKHDRENREAVAILVALRPKRTKAVRVDITLDERLLRIVDTHVSQTEGLNRSRFFSEAARKVLGTGGPGVSVAPTHKTGSKRVGPKAARKGRR